MKPIQLSQGKVALVDDQDFEWINQWKWSALKAGNKCYAIRKGGILMHRMITGALEDQDVDHRNGNGLDNRRENLRSCAPQQNSCNRKLNQNNKTGFKGVRRKLNRFQATIGVKNTVHFLGSFLTPEEAARAYDKAAKKYHGEFAHLNFPGGAA